MTAREATIQLPITDPAKLELTNINVDSTDAKGRGPARAGLVTRRPSPTSERGTPAAKPARAASFKASALLALPRRGANDGCDSDREQTTPSPRLRQIEMDEPSLSDRPDKAEPEAKTGSNTRGNHAFTAFLAR